MISIFKKFLQCHPLNQIPAIHHPVDQMLNAMQEYAHVYQIIKVIRTLAVVLNVFSTMIVLWIELVFETSVWTRVQALVVGTQFAMSWIIYPYVLVQQEWLAMLSFPVKKSKVWLIKKIIFTEKFENKKNHIVSDLEQVQVNPCNPSPCGPNSQCRAINGQAVCSCVSGFLGNPPNCRPECVVSSDCPRNQACNNQKCIDPCSGTCGWKALCQVVNHNPVCSCPSGFTGDPFFRCEFISKNHYLSFCFRKNQQIPNIYCIYLFR